MAVKSVPEPKWVKVYLFNGINLECNRPLKSHEMEWANGVFYGLPAGSKSKGASLEDIAKRLKVKFRVEVKPEPIWKMIG